MHLNKIQDVPYEGHEIYPIHMAHPILSESVWNDDEQREQGNISNGLREDIYYFITGTLGLAGLFEYVCALSQNRSSKIYLLSFENIQNSMPNQVISWFNNEIQMTMPLGILS